MIITPEELVRQGLLTYLIDGLMYPKGRFSVETVVQVNGMKKRADAIFHDEFGAPLMVIECKRKEVLIDEKTISQIAMYNHSLNAPYLLLSNGEDTHILKVDIVKNAVNYLKKLPRYSDL